MEGGNSISDHWLRGELIRGQSEASIFRRNVGAEHRACRKHSVRTGPALLTVLMLVKGDGLVSVSKDCQNWGTMRHSTNASSGTASVVPARKTAN